MGAVDLKHVDAGHEFLGLSGIHEGADHVDIAVEHVVLGVLVGAVDSFFGKEHGNVGTGYTADIGVEVNRTTHFVFNNIQGLAAGPQLFASDGHAADSLGGTFDQAVIMALTGSADDHDMVGAMPGSHAHAANVVLKAAGGDFGGNDAFGLRIDAAKVFGCRQGDIVFEGLGDLLILKRT